MHGCKGALQMGTLWNFFSWSAWQTHTRPPPNELKMWDQNQNNGSSIASLPFPLSNFSQAESSRADKRTHPTRSWKWRDLKQTHGTWVGDVKVGAVPGSNPREQASSVRAFLPSTFVFLLLFCSCEIMSLVCLPLPPSLSLSLSLSSVWHDPFSPCSTLSISYSR